MVNAQDDRDSLINPGTLSLGLTELTVSEDESEAKITVVRTDGSDGTVSLGYATGDDTAAAGSDYINTAGTLTFAPRETSKVITIPILDDALSEGSETFSVAVGDIQGAVLGVPRTAIITINDNDAAASNTLAFSQAEFTVNEGDGVANITVTRTGGSQRAVSVDYAISDDTARAGDYKASSGTLSFAQGETSKTFTTVVADDTLPEREETAFLTLSNPVGIDLGGQQRAVLAIADNDEMPSNFTVETIVSGLDPFEPVAFDWAGENKVLIAERQGIVRVLENGTLLDTPFIDLSQQVNTAGQRGLLGFAVHPEFPQQPFVYLAYTADPPNAEPDGEARLPSRLIRVTADPSTNYTKALPNSQVVLLNIPPGGVYHATGGIRFGTDGSLFYGHGDGNQVVRAIENPDVLQSLDSPYSKIYRINPLTGAGYPGNPFYNGNPMSHRSKVYSYGLRNPFRFAIHPETNEPYIGDVGWNHWEEINTGRGANFGWPYYEGGNGVNLETPAAADSPEAQAFYNSNPDVTAPIYALSHSYGARSIMVGDFYTGDTYPDLYRGALFFTDFTEGNVDALLFDEEGNVESATRFADDIRRISQISMGPDSNLYFLDHDDGTLNRWVFNGIEQNLGDPIVIEAEALSLDTYQIESNNFASGGQVISLNTPVGETGTAATEFTGAAATYQIKIGYFDEVDGVSQLEFLVNDAVIDSWRLNENQTLGGIANAKSFRERILGEVDLAPGDTLTIQGTQHNNEFARVDFIDLIALSSIETA